MRYRNEPQGRDHFWSGFVFGVAIGGSLGVFLATELGRATREKLELAVIDVRGRLNGTTDSPYLEVEEAEEETVITSATETTREELYNSIGNNARLNQTYLLLIFLSTIVVAIGLLKDNVAVVIGAMVIAPLLGPNLAMALGTALGDTDLMWKAFKTGLAGMSLALVLSILIGIFWPLNIESRELLARTYVGLDSAVLAMASGAAAVISLTSGIPSILVGVMVAVALLPPAATMGLMLGAGQTDLAYGAAFLLAVNIVAINLSAKLGFLIQGIKPRTWLEKKKAKQSMQSYIIIWILTLAALLFVIYFHPDFIK